jgi:hypothetical protein
MINHPTLPPPPFPPYAYFPQSNYLSKPMPLMGTTNTGALPLSSYFVPPELANGAFLRNQTFSLPSPPSTVSSTRTNTQYQNGNKNKSNNEQILTSNDSSKTQQINLFTPGITNYSTPIRSKPR